MVLLATYATLNCKGKNKKDPQPASKINSPKSAETLLVKSEIKPPITDPTKSVLTPANNDVKKEASPAPENENKTKDDPLPGKSKEKTQKDFPNFTMPTASTKDKIIKSNEEDKKKKISSGFYQQKSDEDDTLEKVDSLNVEMSDKTLKKKKKTPT